MPITYTEISATGDALPNNRHVLMFPSVASVMDGYQLTLRHTTVTLPPLNVAQIIVKQLGWSMAFAGLRMQENTFSVEFVETSKAPVIKMLSKWQDDCAGHKTHLAKMKADYAVGCQCIAYDTKGESALKVNLYNVWPVTVTYGQFSEESGAMHIQATFSVDCIDIVDVIYADADFERSIPTAQPNPSLWYNSSTGSNFNSGSASNFNVFDSVTSSLGLTNSNASSVIGRYF